MPRQKRSSKVVEYVEKRMTTLASINIPKSGLSDDLNLDALTSSIDLTRAKINQYNAALTVADQLSSEVKELEKSLLTLNDRMLSMIAAKYGRSSAEYQMVGSVRRNPNRKRTAPKAIVLAD